MFRFAAIVTAFACVVLFLILLISPPIYVGTYGVVADDGALFMVRRASPMFAGLSVLLWLGKDAVASPLRDAICWGMVVTFSGVALTGIAAFFAGQAGVTILAAALGEFVLAGLFAAVLWERFRVSA